MRRRIRKQIEQHPLSDDESHSTSDDDNSAMTENSNITERNDISYDSDYSKLKHRAFEHCLYYTCIDAFKHFNVPPRTLNSFHSHARLRDEVIQWLRDKGRYTLSDDFSLSDYIASNDQSSLQDPWCA